MKTILLFLVIFSLFACEKLEKNKPYKDLNWEKTKFGLWKSKNGELGFLVLDASDDKPKDKYITKLHNENGEEVSFNAQIDTSTFEYLGSSFYRDKRTIYRYFSRAGGGNFDIIKVDIKTFQVLGNCYAKDKNHIYGERVMKMENVDYQTFKTSEDCGCFAKDKNHYYFWADTIDITKIEDKESKLMIEKLKKL